MCGDSISITTHWQLNVFLFFQLPGVKTKAFSDDYQVTEVTTSLAPLCRCIYLDELFLHSTVPFLWSFWHRLSFSSYPLPLFVPADITVIVIISGLDVNGELIWTHGRAIEWAYPQPAHLPNCVRRTQIGHIMWGHWVAWSPLWWWPCLTFWVWELYVDCRSRYGEANPSLWRQMLREDA